MNARQLLWLFVVAGVVTIGIGLGRVAATAAQERRSDVESGVEVLTRGPVHEAFAETVTFDPEPGMGVRMAPPEPIEELAPEQRPEGSNVNWIPGYWAWDDERDDFLWVSGVWRALPPGREWVPGYWGRSGHEYQWSSGYWSDAQREDVEYLPEPPASVEVGPNISAPTADHGWIPGSWEWHESRYAWRPGYWMIVRSDWNWIPCHYVWAPRGYVYVEGYWDHPVARRGVLFAPVYFDKTVYQRRNFSYSPVTVINLTVFSDHLFVRPQYHHYYFGDYYAASYRDSGLFASFSFHSNRRGYDPIFAQQRWQHRGDSGWGRRVEMNFSQRRDNEDARPRRTLAAQVSYSKTDARRADRSFTIGSSVEEMSRGDSDGVRFRRLDKDERQQAAERGKEIQRFREERRQAESDESRVSDEPRSKRSEPVRLKQRRSPISPKAGNQLGRDDSPPQRPESPKPDPNVAPKAKKFKEKRQQP